MPLQALEEAHEATKAQFGKLAESRRLLDKARAELTSLTRLGDMVTPEDVIKGAGKLVAEGLSPMAVAKLLSDMPEQGEQLQGWVAQHAIALTAREAQLDPVLGAARHQLGVSAMRVLAGHHLAGTGGQLASPAPAAGNPLLPQQTLIEPAGGPAPPANA